MAVPYPSHRMGHAPVPVPGDRMKVYLEYPDGTIQMVDAFAVSLEHQMGWDNIESYTITLETTGPVSITASMEEVKVKKKKEIEWECSYCGTVNPKESRHCGGTDGRGCGASRPFIYND